MEQEFGYLNILVNTTGILYDTWQTASTADLAVVPEAIGTNLLGAWRMCQVFLLPLHCTLHGRILNVPSEAGSLTSMGNNTPDYSNSKAALNAFTRELAAERQEAGIL